MHFGEYELSPSLIGLSLLHSSHPEAFQRLLVRASIPCYRNFTLDKCRSLGFASASSDCTPSSGSLSLRIGALDPYPCRRRQLVGSLCKRHAVTARAAPTACRRMGSGTISLLCSRCFSPFPHGTGTLSVSREYLALPDGPGRFAQNSSCSALLRIPLSLVRLPAWGCHPLRPSFPERRGRLPSTMSRSYNTAGASPHPRFGLFPGRSPLLGESLVYFLFLQVLRCFSSLRSPPCISTDDSPSDCRVVPFGNLRITGHLHLPEAYRSLSRPSSPP